MLASACTPVPPASPTTAEVTGPALAQACAGRDGWSDPAPPARLAANLFYVGTCGITALLLTSSQGHVLIDGATPKAAPPILANIRRLGLNPSDVRVLLNSHEHVDHAGGLAALEAQTGARLLVRAPARAVFESGRVDAADPQAGTLPPMPAVAVAGTVEDGELVRVGPIALRAIATPGHTAGGTSWTWRICEDGACRNVVYADSISAVSADAYRFSDHPALVAQFRATFDRVARLDCDVLITLHPSASKLFEHLAGAAPLADAAACKAYAETGRQRLDERLARESAR